MWRRATIAASGLSPKPGDYEAFFLKADIDNKKQDVIIIAHKKAEPNKPGLLVIA